MSPVTRTKNGLVRLVRAIATRIEREPDHFSPEVFGPLRGDR